MSSKILGTIGCQLSNNMGREITLKFRMEYFLNECDSSKWIPSHGQTILKLCKLKLLSKLQLNLVQFNCSLLNRCNPSKHRVC